MKSIYTFTGSDGSFRVEDPMRWSGLYFPLVNEAGLLSAMGPRLQGDIKLDQHTFLTPPATTEDLQESRYSRNFWLSLPPVISPRVSRERRDTKEVKPAALIWSVAGQSAWQRALPDGEETGTLEAGLLWHKITLRNAALGVESVVTSFVPADGKTVEIMLVEIKNIGSKPLAFTATSAIPLYGRSADNLRDHRHVTSLLNRLEKTSDGLQLRPTMSFNERGHTLNSTAYFVAGRDEDGKGPAGFFSTVLSFAGEGGDLEAPRSLLEKRPPRKTLTGGDQGQEAMGALQFQPARLLPGKSTSYIVLMGIDRGDGLMEEAVKTYGSVALVRAALERTCAYWQRKTSQIIFKTGDAHFNNWVQWVTAQPTFRKIYGCSFLPDFDYGRGGRGWRDLWQDCLALLLANPEEVRGDIVHNFGGVRTDGSNATIIGRGTGDGRSEFIADRNNISRTWMDHGVWPFLTARLYLNQTGDWKLLQEKAPYFRDKLTHRAKRVDPQWNGDCALRSSDGKIYEGTVLEHMLVQHLVQFFNVGDHNLIRLEDADWNDGLDMAHEKGESAAFTHLYAGNLESLAAVLESAAAAMNWSEVSVFDELGLLLDRSGDKVNYDSVEEKRRRLATYFDATAAGVKGVRRSVSIADLAADLRQKAEWMRRHLNRQEWISLPEIKSAWFNGYYDNTGTRVEGRRPDGHIQMTLTGQVFAIMAGTADKERTAAIVDAVEKYLTDKKLGGIRLNTDFGHSQPALGRAFSFAYGEKENGAVFSHMVVMYANALYTRGFAKDGFSALDSLYQMAARATNSRIYPSLPEYFNNEGRGRYLYLTGSASWYVLTLLTQVFGVRGEGGDLVLAPRLAPEQFDRKKEATVECAFAGARSAVTYRNPSLTPADNARVKSVRAGDTSVPFTALPSGGALIKRSQIAGKNLLKLIVDITQ